MIHLELNQSRLDTFSKCERRFFLQYLSECYVPSRAPILPAEAEERVKQGVLFHQCIERALRGVPVEPLLRVAPDPIVGWVENALKFISLLPAGPRFVEYTLSLPFQDALLTAKYDLLVVCQDKAIIVDWKTTGRPGNAGGHNLDIQRIVFPFVLAEAAPQIGWQQVEPDNIEFIYCFACGLGQTLQFPYSSKLHQQNQDFLENQITSISTRSGCESLFPKIADTPDNVDSLCSRCTFMFHCDRGDTASSVRDLSSVFQEADLDRLFSAETDLDEFEIEF